MKFSKPDLLDELETLQHIESYFLKLISKYSTIFREANLDSLLNESPNFQNNTGVISSYNFVRDYMLNLIKLDKNYSQQNNLSFLLSKENIDKKVPLPDPNLSEVFIKLCKMINDDRDIEIFNLPTKEQDTHLLNQFSKIIFNKEITLDFYIKEYNEIASSNRAGLYG